jgi:raffinose/stachyose/melibiose transport system permease protein
MTTTTTTLRADRLAGSERVQPVTSRRRRSRFRRNWRGYLYVLPAFALFAGVVIVPTLQSFDYSFYSWDGIGAATWVGLDNYVAAFVDPTLSSGFLHILILVFFFTVLPIALGLLTAAIVGRAKMKGMGFYRATLFLPQVIAPAVIVVIWRRILAPDGPLNQGLDAIGLPGLAQNWLGSSQWALPTIGLIGSWTTFGLCMVLFIAGQQSIPVELYEAVRVDGGGPIREFFTVTLPGLRGQIAVATTLTVIGAIQAFDLIWLITQGGPGTATVTPSVNMYLAFTQQNEGLAGAIAMIILAFTLVVSLVVVRAIEGRDVE